MRKFVRESKFRHCYGQPCPKDQLYDGIVASNSRLDGNICAVNRKFIAVVLVSSGGGVFTVLRRDKPGRVDKAFRCIGHTAEVTDLSFDRFNPNRIASAAEDGTFIVWWIPEQGMTDDLSEYQCQLKLSQKRAVQSEWHPSAADILICVNADTINICNVLTSQVIRTIETVQFSEQLFNLSLNYDGTQCAASFKDKKVRIFDLMSGEKTKEFQVHEGSKPIRVAWITKLYDDDIIVTAGATKASERQQCVWKLSNPTEPLFSECLDNSASVFNIFYDVDTKLIVFYSKGESSIRMYEFDMDPEPKLHLVSTFTAQEAHRAVAFGNKLACNFMNNEILHAVRVLPKAVEEVSFYVPRRSEQFQDDLFPESYSETPAMTAEDFTSGKKAQPTLVSLKNYVFPDGFTPVLAKLSSSQSTIRKQSIASKTNSVTSVVGGASAVNIADLYNEINEIKTQLAQHKERLEKLEEKK